jgi:DNA-binding NtrC family response regulator
MSSLEHYVEQIAPASCPVFLVGPGGTGKHALALRIYQLSSRLDGSFLELQCERAAENVFAASSRYLAVGTLYLDEVSALSAANQSALLDAYFGGHTSWEQLPRLIAATVHNRDEIGREGEVDAALYGCLGAVMLHLPLLRERGRDVLLLAEHFIRSYASDFGRPEPPLSKDLVDFFVDYDWPGNIDELEAASKALVALGDGRATVAALRASALRSQDAAFNPRSTSLKLAARAASQRAEHALIIDVLKSTSGNRKKAAQQLQISYKALLYKLKQISLSCGSAPQGGEDL